MKLVGIGLIILGIILFGLIFFALTPYIQSMVPDGEWQELIQLVILVIIGYCGGLGVPLVMIIGGGFLIKD